MGGRSWACLSETYAIDCQGLFANSINIGEAAPELASIRSRIKLVFCIVRSLRFSFPQSGIEALVERNASATEAAGTSQLAMDFRLRLSNRPLFA